MNIFINKNTCITILNLSFALPAFCKAKRSLLFNFSNVNFFATNYFYLFNDRKRGRFFSFFQQPFLNYERLSFPIWFTNKKKEKIGIEKKKEIINAIVWNFAVFNGK